ncbi:MAG: sigma-70 family RNA polymerase sigma factor [Bacteroidetes bacterium]|nr:sigma-70 family RNA polymerase sigma factor [Bacteroidota bacterium]
MSSKNKQRNKETNPFTPVCGQREENRYSDRTIIRSAKNGDEKAFLVLKQKYAEPLYKFLARIIKQREELDDLVQESFIKAFTSIQQFNEEYAFSTWLFKIATNTTIDFLRKKKIPTISINSTLETEEDEYSFQLPDKEPIPDQQLIAHQRSSVLMEAIEALPPKYRKVIILRHVEEMEYTEIAKVLKIPLSTIKAHIFRAREMLYKQLKHKLRQY